MNTTTRVILTVLLCAAAAACTKKVKDNTPQDSGTDVNTSGTTTPNSGGGTPYDSGPARTGAYAPGDLDTDACLRQRVVYFDFDQDALKPEFQNIVACHAKYLRDRPSARMTLEGNADERGSREYNVGLGERRGNAVSSAVQANGASGGPITVVSYGEERPTCTESSEDCWGQNRRVEIVYTAK
ncbi:MAG: peptidoglycan-associated lipoprotein Pal [Lysobacter sp.]|nr:peptidoglycan-associated lipoprotein Pal [Lysobacter sp.]